MIDSWHRDVWDRLQNSRQQHKFPHALLLQGPVGIGKDELARLLSQSLLCQNTADIEGMACGQCQSCRLFNSGNHPDFLQISPEEAGKAIKVDQIRQMVSALAMTSHAGGYKVVVITPADNMNINAANSLLKTLEEPTDNTLILLVSVAPACLPATVRSRCQSYTCVLPETGVARNWLSQQLDEGEDIDALLELANGAPYTALKLHETDAIKRWLACLEQLAQLANGQLDPVTTAAGWNKKDGLQQVDWFLHALQRMMVTLKTGRQVEQDRLTKLITGDLRSLDCKRLFILMDNISYAINNWSTGLNTQLLIEDILISWAAIFRRSALASGQN